MPFAKQFMQRFRGLERVHGVYHMVGKVAKGVKRGKKRISVFSFMRGA